MSIKTSILIFVAFFSLFALTGCKKTNDKVAEKVIQKAVKNSLGKDSNVDVDINGNGKKVTVKNKETGEYVETSAKGDLEIPAEWPAEIKIYKPSKLVFVANNVGGIQLTFQTDDSLEKIKNWNIEQVKKSGWQEIMNMDVAGNWMGTYQKNDNQISFVAGANKNQGGKDNVITYNYLKANH